MITKTQINFMVEAAIIIKNVSRIEAEKIVSEYIKENKWVIV